MRDEVGVLIGLTNLPVTEQYIVTMGSTCFPVSWASLVENIWSRGMETEQQS